MKNDTLIIIAAAAAGLYFIARVAKGGAVFGTTVKTSPIVTGADQQAAVMGPTTPNQYLTLADQYREYGYGQAVANVYDQQGYLGVQK
jgi:hypothetical protein